MLRILLVCLLLFSGCGYRIYKVSTIENLKSDLSILSSRYRLLDMRVDMLEEVREKKRNENRYKEASKKAMEETNNKYQYEIHQIINLDEWERIKKQYQKINAIILIPKD